MTTFSNLNIIKMINHSNSFVYEVTSKESPKRYALKIFPLVRGGINPSYYSEARWKWMEHPNTIKIHKVNPYIQEFKGLKDPISCILMEYAPFGDLWKAILTGKFTNNSRLVRSYFHQLIGGLEYLHENGIAHMDLKPQNILIGENYILKIIDFDNSHPEEDVLITSSGTECYRAPEVQNQKCNNPKSADIYSVGIILFTMVVGVLPYEDENHDLWKMMLDEDPKFWEYHDAFIDFGNDFKSLFSKMVKKDPIKRASLLEIKSSNWYRGDTFSDSEIKKIMSGNSLDENFLGFES